MVKVGLALLGLFTLAVAANAEEPPPSSCTSSPLRVGECFTVHGRLKSCNGVPNVTIWIVGTKRIFGVEDAKGNPAADQLLPGRLDDEMSVSPRCSRAAYGDFTVCPLTPSIPKVMQRVCVAKAGKLVIKDDR